MSQIPDFIPAIPNGVVTDLSNTLSPTALKAIENTANSLNYRPLILVLPANYKAPAVHELSLSLAKAWHTDAGKTLLIVVDLQGHKVRMIGSPALNESGITSDFITNELVPKDFIPYMKVGDLSSAIRLSLSGVNNQLAVTETHKQNAQPTSPGSATQSQSASPPTPAAIATFWGSVLAGLCILSIFILLVKTKLNAGAFSNLKEPLDSLYVKADQLGQASGFIDPIKNERLSHKISDFFAQIKTLENAYGQMEKLVHSPLAVGRAGNAIGKCSRYIAILTKHAEDLLEETNALTGVISTYEPQAAIEAPATQECADTQNRLSHPSQLKPAYRMPVWVSDRQILTAPDRALTDMGDFLDQQSAADSYQFPTSSPKEFAAENNKLSSSNGGGSWNSGSSSSDSSSSSSDGGGSWDSDSSSSDSSSSSSDGGGSW